MHYGRAPAHLDLIATALGVFVEELAERIDGRLVALLGRLAIGPRAVGGRLLDAQEAGDVRDRQGGVWQVRALTERGVQFSPSFMKGAGRRHDVDRFNQHLDVLAGFIVVALVGNAWQWWVIESQQVKAWDREGLLGAAGRIGSRDAFKNAIALAGIGAVV